MVESLDGKSKGTIDLTQDIQPQLYKLDRLLKRATVFLSYSHHDREIADRIRQALEQHDYSAWLDTAIPPGDDWAAAIRSAIDDAVARGFVLVTLSPASLASQYCKHGTEYALELAARPPRSNVIPVVIRPFAPGGLSPALAHHKWFDLTTGPFEERVEELIRSLKTREME